MEGLYNTIGSDYNSTRQADPYLLARINALLTPADNELYFDIGCGTGNYTIALAEKGLCLYGIEPSDGMLETAAKNSDRIIWLKGSAEAIPTANEYFNGGIATLTIHHWADLDKAFTELDRVLKPGARMVVFTSTPEQMRGFWLNHYFPKMLAQSIMQMPSLEMLSNVASAAGFTMIATEKYFVQNDLRDHFLYSGKNRPQLYFDGQIRAGISSFSALAHVEEVNAGLEMLDYDLKAGVFDEVKRQYENNEGDYLFITFKKGQR